MKKFVIIILSFIIIFTNSSIPAAAAHTHGYDCYAGIKHICDIKCNKDHIENGSVITNNRGEAIYSFEARHSGLYGFLVTPANNRVVITINGNLFYDGETTSTGYYVSGGKPAFDWMVLLKPVGNAVDTDNFHSINYGAGFNRPFGHNWGEIKYLAAPVKTGSIVNITYIGAPGDTAKITAFPMCPTCNACFSQDVAIRYNNSTSGSVCSDCLQTGKLPKLNCSFQSGSYYPIEILEHEHTTACYTTIPAAGKEQHGCDKCIQGWKICPKCQGNCVYGESCGGSYVTYTARDSSRYYDEFADEFLDVMKSIHHCTYTSGVQGSDGNYYPVSINGYQTPSMFSLSKCSGCGTLTGSILSIQCSGNCYSDNPVKFYPITKTPSVCMGNIQCDCIGGYIKCTSCEGKALKIITCNACGGDGKNNYTEICGSTSFYSQGPYTSYCSRCQANVYNNYGSSCSRQTDICKYCLGKGKAVAYLSCEASDVTVAPLPDLCNKVVTKLDFVKQ